MGANRIVKETTIINTTIVSDKDSYKHRVVVYLGSVRFMLDHVSMAALPPCLSGARSRRTRQKGDCEDNCG